MGYPLLPWLPFVPQDSVCSSLYSWSGANWNQQVKLLRLGDTVVISILFFFATNLPAWSVGTRKGHAGVVSVNYLYWVSQSLVPRDLSAVQGVFVLSCNVSWLILSVLFPISTIHFFISKTVLTRRTCISICWGLWRSLLLFF